MRCLPRCTCFLSLYSDAISEKGIYIYVYVCVCVCVIHNTIVYHLLFRYESLAAMKFIIDDADFENYWKTLYWPKEILKVTEDCQQRLETGRQEFIDELVKDREKLAESIEEISASIEEFVSSGDIEQV